MDAISSTSHQHLMQDSAGTVERQRSQSPTGVPPEQILEWNFFASRINSIVTMLLAHKRLNLPVNKRNLADGMQIELVSAKSVDYDFLHPLTLRYRCKQR